LRGQRSQQQLARRLGYTGNPITEWERGRRFPTVHEVLEIARVCGVDVGAAFARFAPNTQLEKHGTGFAVAEWLTAARGGTSIGDLAQRADRSRYSVSRWLKGSATPRLPDFLRLLDAITGRVPDWLAEFVPIERVPSVGERYSAALVARRLAFDAPWTEAILRLLETTQYQRYSRHEDAWLAYAARADATRPTFRSPWTPSHRAPPFHR
jgi:transcriptional regulator with XRE-family HTH domain